MKIMPPWLFVGRAFIPKGNEWLRIIRLSEMMSEF